MDILPRRMTPVVSDYLRTFRVVLVGGARQTGKTTLVRDLLSVPGARAISLDDEAVLQRAMDDPAGLLDTLGTPLIIDEYQRAGRGLLLAIKARVDRSSEPGQIVLTGSTGYESSSMAVDTLAGRMGRVRLWTLSTGEAMQSDETFVDRVFDPAERSFWPARPASRTELVALVLRGGYPEVVARNLDARSRHRWLQAYVDSVVSREALRPVADVRRERELRQMLRLVAARVGHQVVMTDLAVDADLGRNTVSDYLGLLEALGLVHPVPAWVTSATTRAKRRPRLVVTDSGLAADLAGAGPETFAGTADGVLAGGLFENWVMGELLRQCGWAERDIEVLTFRDREGREVDAILEDRATGRIVGVEAKLTSTPTARDARWLAWLRGAVGDRFVRGVVVHAGPPTLPLGDRLWAVPATALWDSGPMSS